MKIFQTLSAFGLALLLAAVPALAQEKQIPWEKGPCVGKLGGVAEVQVPKGMLFTSGEGVKTFYELTENIYDPSHLGVILVPGEKEGEEPWFAIFSFDALGYVKDDEKASLDAKAILESIKEGTSKANGERRKRGWPTMEVLGWQQQPFYDAATHNLTWSVLAHAENEKGNVLNHSVRLLGRSGVMKIDMVTSPEIAKEKLPQFNGLVGAFHYTAGNRYAEFKAGDKVAAIGLTALVAGGAGAALAKSGLLGKLWKFLLLGLAAAAGAIRKLWNKLFGKETVDPQG
ncbi:MAG TPA: DUF2167 domain-containing protein [Holophaga sp.]|nr:DUF2167 domain-containing protein [Holophaga sp.]